MFHPPGAIMKTKMMVLQLFNKAVNMFFNNVKWSILARWRLTDLWD